MKFSVDVEGLEVYRNDIEFFVDELDDEYKPGGELEPLAEDRIDDLVFTKFMDALRKTLTEAGFGIKERHIYYYIWEKE
jgi:hypothetical protein